MHTENGILDFTDEGALVSGHVCKLDIDRESPLRKVPPGQLIVSTENEIIIT